MWKKEQANPSVNVNTNVTTPTPTWTTTEEAAVQTTGQKVSTVGPSLELEGTIRGEDDLFLQGKVKGTIELRSNSVTVGREGKVEGDIFARIVHVEGLVKGNLQASERIIVHRTGQVTGTVTCERVSVEDGASVNGTIDMSRVAPPESKKNNNTEIGSTEEEEDITVRFSAH